jgi:hypothetical protein
MMDADIALAVHHHGLKPTLSLGQFSPFCRHGQPQDG